MEIKYPKISEDSKGRVFISFYYKNQRYRVSNGSKLNLNIYPNSHPPKERTQTAKLLAAEIYKFLLSGRDLESFLKFKKSLV